MPEPKPSILIVDDELSIRESFELILTGNYRVVAAASGEATLKKVTDEKIDLVYLDIRMPGMDGMETLKRIKEIDKDLAVVMVTAVNDVGKASEAVKLGAEDYVVKPFDVDEILNLTQKLIEKKALLKETKMVREVAVKRGAEIELLGQTKVMKEIEKIIEKVGKSDSPILIQGQPGVEKEFLVRVLHEVSPRAGKPLIIFEINPEISEHILREKFFGSGKGDFTAALRYELGLFEKAAEGTLYLSNIENLPLPLQKDLAENLSRAEIKRVGSEAPIPINVRLISSTNLILKDLVKEGTFDKDLYHLLSETSIDLPPLRQRLDDLPLFIQYYLEKFNKKYNKNFKGFTKEALEVLSGYGWPGNIEELENLLRLLTLTTVGDYFTLKDLSLDLILKSTSLPVEELKDINLEALSSRFEKEFIEKVLQRVAKDRGKAARLLELSLPVLQSKL